MSRLLLAVCACALLATGALAQYQTDFETLNGSPNGVVLTGQDGYYLPSGSVDFKVYTYAGNVLGIPQNPTGGAQFVAGVSVGTAYGRAQRNISTFPWFWKFEYDLLGAYAGTVPATNNLGSFSLRLDALALNTYINLMYFPDVNNPTYFNLSYLAYDAAGNQFAQPGLTPGPQWENLSMMNWYHAYTKVDFDTNKITECGLKNIMTGEEWVAYPVDWYMVGGVASPGTPDALRMFAGGTTPGNTSAWDNLSMEPMIPGACCFADGHCEFLIADQCAAAGGTFMGENIPCDPNPCSPPPVEWACCFPDGTCRMMLEADCANAGGVWQGQGITCDPNPCTNTPTQETTWGRIKAGFR